jgi:hypothetical protein
MSAILIIALPFVALMWMILRDADQRKTPNHVSSSNEKNPFA